MQNVENGKSTQFIQRCVPFADKVKGKKSAQQFKAWKQQLILYDLTVKYLKNNGRRPRSQSEDENRKQEDRKLWSCLERAYLEQYATAPQGQRRKRMRFSMTKRSKMRIAALVLLLALGVGFWKISVDACKDIAADLKIPDTVIMGGFGLLGCIEKDNIVQMVTKPSLKSPGQGFEGPWWQCGF